MLFTAYNDRKVLLVRLKFIIILHQRITNNGRLYEQRNYFQSSPKYKNLRPARSADLFEFKQIAPPSNATQKELHLLLNELNKSKWRCIQRTIGLCKWSKHPYSFHWLRLKIIVSFLNRLQEKSSKSQWNDYKKRND